MTERKVFVHVELGSEIYLVGTLWARTLRDKEGASFQYEQSWLSHKERFALEPALELTDGTYHTDADRSIFGAIGDSAPDRWGRILMKRALARKARHEGKKAVTLHEIDYLLGVYDEARQGALRFSEKIGGPFLQSDRSPIPPLIELPKLLSATEKVLEDKESEEELRLLLAPGASLGGARPKASVREKDGQLAIAKFPCKSDEFSTTSWEAVALTLAKRAKILVPDWRLESIVDKPTLIIKRFDRESSRRIPFLSALSMIGGKDNEQHSYLEVVDALKRYGAYPANDIVDLWRRIVFNILISNTDDHLRNLGFLYERYKGWKLAPHYDLNPTPLEIRPRVLATNIDLDDGEASILLALRVADEFGLTQKDAKQIAKEVGDEVKNWKKVANHFQIESAEIERMASAFEHDDLAYVLRLF